MEIKATKRTVLGKANKNIRKEGLLPASLFGKNVETETLAVDTLVFKKLFAEAGHSTLVDLMIEKNKPVKVLIQEVQS
jgi:large subunit ribosomal protein L25